MVYDKTILFATFACYLASKMQLGNVPLAGPADVTRKSKFDQGIRNELLVALQNVSQGNEV